MSIMDEIPIPTTKAKCSMTINGIKPDTMEYLNIQARLRGLQPSTMARMILERVAEGKL